MPSYRFCRPDDIPYLVRAVNECYDVHFPAAAPMTLERFRTEMKTLDLWPSNCLIASSDDGPIAVLIGTKRVDEVNVLRIGLRPDHQRRGHGAHLLTSLSQKLAVLGPGRLISEVPRALTGVSDFFAATAYRREVAFTDFVRAPAPVEAVPGELVIPITVDELIDHQLLDIPDEVAWRRRRETLVNGKDDFQGLAIATPERIEAFLLHQTTDAATDIVALGARSSERSQLFLSLLLRSLAGKTELPLRLPKLAEGEVSASLLSGLGFEASAVYDRYAATATPA